MPKEFSEGAKRPSEPANARCSNPSCRIEMDYSEGSAVAVADGTVIWLCPGCARLVKSDRLRFTPTVLRMWKTASDPAAEDRASKPPR